MISSRVTHCQQPGSSIGTQRRAKLFREEPEAGNLHIREHGPHLRRILHDQGPWHGDGIVDLPFDYRGAWRSTLGISRNDAWNHFLHHIADTRLRPPWLRWGVGKIGKTDIERHRADMTIANAWINQHPVRATRAAAEDEGGECGV
jgi:hypothetical protein